MKLTAQRSYYETSGDMDEVSFDIKDKGMIFDILRNKMYSNPILSICREISCNARDAHREVGIGDTPIQIQLPNSLEPFYKIKDFGPGISPDRMYNIYIQYTASSKRADNTQTGGFGLGAKTPFSYSDSFNIVTIVNGIKYNYAAAIDETRVGKIVLLSKEETSETNGTEIVIPVKLEDFKKFITSTEIATRYWDVKPIIIGYDDNFSWVTSKIIFEGSNWSINDFNSDDSYQGYSSYRGYGTSRHAKCLVIIDGIEYSLDHENLGRIPNSKFIDSIRGNLLIYFNIGELTLSANREQIHFDNQTIDKIASRFSSIFSEIKLKLNNSINECKNLWDANVYIQNCHKNVFHSLSSFINLLAWNGIPLQYESLFKVNCNVYNFLKGKYTRMGHDPNKISRSFNKSFSFENNSMLVLNDTQLKDVGIRHIKKLFDDNSLLTKVVLIAPIDNQSIKDLNASYHFDKMGAKLLSDLISVKLKKRSNQQKLLVYKYVNHNFVMTPYSSIKDDKNKKVLCKLSSSYNNIKNVIFHNSGKTFNCQNISHLTDYFKNISFYGIGESIPDEKLKNNFDDFISLDDFIEKNIINNSDFDFHKIKYAAFRARINNDIVDFYDEIKNLITDKNSVFLDYCKLHCLLSDLKNKQLGLLNIYELYHNKISNEDIKNYIDNNSQYDLDHMIELFNSKYKLLSNISTFSYRSITEDIAHYVNLIDKN